MTTFMTLRGQFDNVGDVILRRQLGRWIPGPSVAYVGAAPDEFIDGLELCAETQVERSFGHFARAMALAPPRSSYVFKPGETQLSPAGMKENLGLVPLLARLRSRGGSAVRVGVGARGDSHRYAALCRPSIALSSINMWRDARTHELMGRGGVMPDLAFGEGSDPSDWIHDRSLLVVSLRGDRPAPNDAWLAAVMHCASERSLDIVVISQVRRDDESATALASILGVDAVLCQRRTSSEIESELRGIYRRSALVVSNRLHVLIAALTEGARVSCCVPGGSTKIFDHLDVVGLGEVAVDSEALSTQQCAAVFSKELDALRDIGRIVVGARSKLTLIRKQVVQALAPDAEHPGRTKQAAT